MRFAEYVVLIAIALTALTCQAPGGAPQGPAGSDPGAPVAGTVASADGLEIHFRAEGSGTPALVFVHGWSCDGGYWDAQRQHFAKAHRVVTVDLGGHGASGLGRGDWTMAAFAADVRAVVEYLDLEDVVLIGHSMGGAVIVEAALAMPERVRGLVGVDTFHEVSLVLTDEQLEGFVGPLREDFRGNVPSWVTSMFPDPDGPLAEEIARDMASAPPEVGLRALNNYLIWYRERAKDALGRLRVPLRCINSDMEPTNTEALSALIEGYALRTMPGRGHFLMREDPATFNLLLEETLAALPAAPPGGGQGPEPGGPSRYN